MIAEKKEALQYYQFKNLSQHNSITHFISTRFGGVSSSPYDSLNLGLGTDDLLENAIENRKRLAQTFNIPLKNYCVPNQTHSKNVEQVTHQDKGRGVISKENCILDTDGLITNQTEICLMVLSADCVPVLFFDPIKKVVAATHAGWRGTVQKIAQITLQKMVQEYHCSPQNILVSIGPSISVRHYEIGDDVVEATEKAFGTKEGYLQWNKATSKYHFDLWFANQQQLLDVGVPQNNIEVAGLCTYEMSDTFFSSRKDKGITGRFGAGIMLI